MIAGIPGIGIGGIFYFLCVAFMPFKELGNTIRGKTSKYRWNMVAQQAALLCGIMAGFWGTGLILGIMIHRFSVLSTGHAAVPAGNIFHVKPLYFSLLTLCVVLGGVRVINLLLDRKGISSSIRRRKTGKSKR